MFDYQKEVVNNYVYNKFFYNKKCTFIIKKCTFNVHFYYI